MEFSLLFELQTDDPTEEHRVWREALEQIELADRVGFDQVWAVEHHFLVRYAHSSAPEVLLAAAAARTERIRLGHGVVVAPPPVNHPFRIAERVAALDIVSDGRVDVGFGRGFSVHEQEAFGLDPARSRAMTAEAVRALPRMWTDETYPGFTGEFLDLPPRQVIPKPVQRPHPPMWWACTSPPSFELAGGMGLGCLCFAFQRPESLTERLDAYRSAVRGCDPVGAFANEKIAGYTVALCGDDDAEAKRLGGAGYLFNLARWLEYIRPLAEVPGHDWYKELLDNPLVEALDAADPAIVGPELTDLGYCALGDPTSCIEVVKRFETLGIDHLIMLMQTAGVPGDRVRRSIELFGSEVIPAVRGRAA